MNNSWSSSNKKLGRGMLSFSREVGPTCPASCIFLDNGCYASRMQAMRPNVKAAYQRNELLHKPTAIQQVVDAIKHSYAIRLHVAGDFMLNGSLDVHYLNEWNNVLTTVKLKYGKLPHIWAYTHMYDNRIVKTFAGFPEVSIYASVHNDADLQAAKAAGFSLFAWATEYTQKSQKTDKVSVKLELANEWFVVCPEQRRKYDELDVTCASCKLCVTGKANVAFLKH